MAEDELSNGEIRRALGRIERMLEKAIEDHNSRDEALDVRIRALENQNATLRGWLIGAAASGGVGALTGLLALFGG